MKTANPIQQNKLLSLVLEDCYLDEQRLIYKLQKPFDKLVNLKLVHGLIFKKKILKNMKT